MTNQYSGFVTIIGRPNVGKSTLINQLIGQKVSIVCRKRQTTRHNVLGVQTHDDTQIVFVDTPGIHQDNASYRLNHYMNQQAVQALDDVEAVVWMIDHHWRDADDVILKRLQAVVDNQPVILVINKIDQLSDKSQLLPLIEYCQSKMAFDMIIPISALDSGSADYLTQQLQPFLLEHPFFFPVDHITDRSERFQLAEMVREQLFDTLNDELPYGLTVYIDHFEKKPMLWHVEAVILVTTASHKKIVIGRQGSKLKHVGQKARQVMEKHFQKKVYLQLWVKVKEDWYNSDYWLNQIDQQ